MITLRAAAIDYGGRFVTSVGTCRNNRSNERRFLVKGIAGAGLALDDDGNRGQRFAIAPDQQPNCRAGTYTYSTCPARMVAMGLDVRLNVIGGKQAITGLQLRCRDFGPVNTQIGSGQLAPLGSFSLQRP